MRARTHKNARTHAQFLHKRVFPREMRFSIASIAFLRFLISTKPSGGHFVFSLIVNNFIARVSCPSMHLYKRTGYVRSSVSWLIDSRPGLLKKINSQAHTGAVRHAHERPGMRMIGQTCTRAVRHVRDWPEMNISVHACF